MKTKIKNRTVAASSGLKSRYAASVRNNLKEWVFDMICLIGGATLLYMLLVHMGCANHKRIPELCYNTGQKIVCKDLPVKEKSYRRGPRGGSHDAE